MNNSKRTFLRLALGAPALLSLTKSSVIASAFGGNDNSALTPAQTSSGAPYTLPPLGYSFDALEPHIDAQTMQLHHDRHHQAYVDNLNKAVASYPNLRRLTPEQLVSRLNAVPAAIRTTVRNNGGGHVNHTMCWRIMKPNGGGEPTGEIARIIRNQFGGFESFKTRFNDAGAKQFGSGWAWLVRGRGNRYSIISTANQDSPLMQGLYPVMGNDVWEHAYYLKYNNRRADYLTAWWNVVNWDEVNNRLRAAR